MAQQTAVEWLMEQYNLGNGYERHLTESDFEQAKQMEKEQIIDAVNLPNYKLINERYVHISGEKYYNETYNK